MGNRLNRHTQRDDTPPPPTQDTTADRAGRLEPRNADTPSPRAVPNMYGGPPAHWGNGSSSEGSEVPDLKEAGWDCAGMMARVRNDVNGCNSSERLRWAITDVKDVTNVDPFYASDSRKSAKPPNEHTLTRRTQHARETTPRVKCEVHTGGSLHAPAQLPFLLASAYVAACSLNWGSAVCVTAVLPAAMSALSLAIDRQQS